MKDFGVGSWKRKGQGEEEEEEEEEEETVQEIISEVAEDIVAYTLDNLIEISNSFVRIITQSPPEQPCICSKYVLVYSTPVLCCC